MSLFNDKEREIIQSHPFAQILTSQLNQTGFAQLSYCPLQLISDHRLLGHLAANNPLLKAINNATTKETLVKVIFTGPHGYISPRWHSEQLVPTWNYAAVSLTCTMSLIEETEDKLMAMESISQYFDPQWNFNEFNQEQNLKKVQQMLSAITVFHLDIIETSSKFKLSQNRSVDCRQAFQKNLIETGYGELAQLQFL